MSRKPARAWIPLAELFGEFPSPAAARAWWHGLPEARKRRVGRRLVVTSVLRVPSGVSAGERAGGGVPQASAAGPLLSGLQLLAPFAPRQPKAASADVAAFVPRPVDLLSEAQAGELIGARWATLTPGAQLRVRRLAPLLGGLHAWLIASARLVKPREKALAMYAAAVASYWPLDKSRFRRLAASLRGNGVVALIDGRTVRGQDAPAIDGELWQVFTAQVRCGVSVGQAWRDGRALAREYGRKWPGLARAVDLLDERGGWTIPFRGGGAV